MDIIEEFEELIDMCINRYSEKECNIIFSDMIERLKEVVTN